MTAAIAPLEALELFLPVVVEGHPATRSTRSEEDGSLLEFLLLPATGGSFLLASLRSAASFRAGLKGLPISRPIWLCARAVLSSFSRVGLHRHVGLKKISIEIPAGECEGLLDFSLQSGVPGGGQKFIIREHGEAGDLVAFWKVGRAGLPAELIEAECAALTWLSGQASADGLAPRLLSRGVDAKKAWLRMSAIEGSKVPIECTRLIADFTERLASTSQERSKITESAWHQRISTRLEAIETSAPQTSEVCRAALSWSTRRMGDELFTFHPAHGDLTPWNALCRNDQLAAFDWEFFQSDAPSNFDGIHWRVQTGVLVQHLSVAGLIDSVREQLASGADGEPRCWRESLALYLVDVLSREEMVFLHGKPEFPQVEWLAQSRRGMLQQICGASSG